MDLARWRRLTAGAVRVAAGGRVPLHVSWTVTHRCNLRCAYCDRPDQKVDELKTPEALRLLDTIANAGCAQLSVTGGDPLVRDDLPLLLARARRHGLRINLNTNGLLVRKNLSAVRLSDTVTISIDGPERVHDAVRGKGSFARAMDGADAARAAGLPVRYYTVIGRSNIPELDALVSMAENRGDEVFFQPGSLELLGSGGGVNPDAAPTDVYRDAIDRIIAWKRAGQPIGNSVRALEVLRRWPDPHPVPCMGGRLFVRIESDGRVRACGRTPRPGDVDILRDGIKTSLSCIDVPAGSCCYSAARMEVNLMARGDVSAIFGFFSRSN
ncbi:radical SAM protein [bacterium]|nr:radical SAM protein [bacterium]